MEEQFKKKLSEVKIDWDKEQLWQNLEPKLPSARRKNPWLGLLLLFLAGLALFLSIYQDAPTSSSHVQVTEAQNLKLDIKVDGEKVDGQSKPQIVSPKSTQLELIKKGQGQSHALKTLTDDSQKEINDNALPLKITNPENIYALDQTLSIKTSEDNHVPLQDHLLFNLDAVSQLASGVRLNANTTRNDSTSATITRRFVSVLSLLELTVSGIKSDPRRLPESTNVDDIDIRKHPGLFLDLGTGVGLLSRSVSFDALDLDLAIKSSRNQACFLNLLLNKALLF